MAKREKGMDPEIFGDIVGGLEAAIAYEDGRAVEGLKVHHVSADDVDVRAIRLKLGMTQEAFCSTFALNQATVRQWEQRRRQPRGPERVLLKVIDKEPDAVRRALSS